MEYLQGTKHNYHKSIVGLHVCVCIYNVLCIYKFVWIVCEYNVIGLWLPMHVVGCMCCMLLCRPCHIGDMGRPGGGEC